MSEAGFKRALVLVQDCDKFGKFRMAVLSGSHAGTLHRSVAAGDRFRWLGVWAWSGGRGVRVVAVRQRPALHGVLVPECGNLPSVRLCSGGRCKDRPQLAEGSIPLEAKMSVVPCRPGEEFLRGLFEPLGYAIEVERHALDTHFPD